MPANGQWPADLLVEVEPGNYLSIGTGRAWIAMKEAAARDGVRLAIADPAGAYRSLYVQRDMRDRPWLYNLNSASKAGLAAPGKSTHGNGDRVDVIGVGSLAWMLRNAARFGFTREFGASDPNHFKHDGRTAITAAATTQSTPQKRKKNPMLLYQISDKDGTNWLVVFNGKARIMTSGIDDHEWQQIVNLHGNPVAVGTRALFNAVSKFYGATRA